MHKITPTVTPTQTRVLALLVRGMSNKMIARKLGASSRTIEVHRRRIVEAYGTRTSWLAAVMAIIDNRVEVPGVAVKITDVDKLKTWIRDCDDYIREERP